MSDLEQNLSMLGTLVPALPAQIERVVGEGTECIAAARRYLADVTEKRREALDLLSKVRNALTTLKDGATEDQVRLQQGLEAARSALEAAVGAFTDGEQDVRLAAEGGVNATAELQRTLERAADRGRQAQADLGSKAAAAVVRFEEAQADIEGAVGTAASTAASIESAITKGQESVKAAAETLDAALEPVAGAVETLLNDGTMRLNSELTDLQSAVESAMDDLGRRGGALVGTLREALDEEREALASYASRVEDALAGLGEKALTPVEDLASARAEASSGLDTLQEQQTALKKGIQAVRKTAQEIPIEWPS